MVKLHDNSEFDTSFEPRTIGVNKLSSDDISILHDLERKNNIAYNDKYVSEFLKCRNNIFYFIHNYCNVGEVGLPLLYSKELMNKKYRRVIKSLDRYKKCILMASRQLGKSTLASCIIAHNLVFFPGIKNIIFNMDMASGVENISKVKFVLENLPQWMNFLPKSKASPKTFIELTHGSKVAVIYPSTIKSPEQLSRSLTIPTLYIDEGAFIRHISRIFTAAQPTLSTARQQAEKHGYPYWIFLTSTPNGIQGPGEFFYQYWDKAIDSDLLFETDNTVTPANETNQNLVYEKWKPDADKYVNNSSTNSFVRVKFHWSEDPRRDDEWYAVQRQELNFDTRKIGQELDLQFVGSTANPFSDEVLKQLQNSIRPAIKMINLPHSASLKIFKEPNPDDYLLIGVDTASAIEGCFSAVEVFSFKNFEQIAELAIRVGSLNTYSDIVIAICEYFEKIMNGRIIIAIENNSIGKAVVENVAMTDLTYYLYYEKDKVKNGIPTDFGISTNARTKPFMIAELYKFINEGPEYFYSEDLINQVHAVERNNAGQISSSSYTDLFMAVCFCAYARKMKELEIMPQLTVGLDNIQNTEFNIMQKFIEMSSNKTYIGLSEQRDNNLFMNDDTHDENVLIPKEDGDDDSFQFFFS